MADDKRDAVEKEQEMREHEREARERATPEGREIADTNKGESRPPGKVQA